MTERPLTSLSDDELGDAISRLGDGLEWPATPDVASLVGAAIRRHETEPGHVTTPRLSLPSRRRTMLLIAAALLLLAGAALAARLVIELGAVAVEVLPGRPTALPTNVAAPADLGREVTLDEAARLTGFPPALPTALGPPDRVWVDEAEVSFEHVTAARLVASWEPSATLPEIPRTDMGALLMQFEGDWEVASKQLSAETNDFGAAIVNGRDAFWTTGEHELELVSGDEMRRLLVTGNVLIWQDAGSTFRLETALPEDDAIAIAESVTPLAELG
jgi:hypothetical protein